jgi:NAD(P)-dependent dehydrogenase (short-subunit alcohol dehydrogenase family)
MPVEPKRALLTDRVAVVTGAAAGLGEAVALALARFGAHVAVCDRDADGLAATAAAISAAGRRTLPAVLDVRDGPAVAAFVAEVGRAFSRIDVLVNNAGGGFHAPFLEVSERGQTALVDENFTSVTHFVRAVAPWMGAGGSIINLTSIEAHRAGPGYAIYSAMKAAVASLTRSLALELGERGIRVNCIAPDRIPTQGVGPLVPGTPLLRAGEPDDVAGAAVFLASDLAGFVTGTTLHVDGGTHAAGGWRRGSSGSFEP